LIKSSTNFDILFKYIVTADANTSPDQSLVHSSFCLLLCVFVILSFSYWFFRRLN